MLILKALKRMLQTLKHERYIMTDDKLFTQAELDAAVKKATDATLARATKGMVKAEDFETLKAEKEFAEEKLILREKLPKLQETYKALGGKGEVFDDYFAKHKEELLKANEDEVEKTIKATIEKTKYAFDTKDGNDPSQKETQEEEGSLLI